MLTITPDQMREARRLLGWSQVDSAVADDASPKTIVNIEAGRPVLARTVAKIKATLESAGIEFIAESGGGAGVRLRRFQ